VLQPKSERGESELKVRVPDALPTFHVHLRFFTFHSAQRDGIIARILRSLLAAVIILAAVTLSAQPNIVLISIDTLRADHLSMYGYGVETSPFLVRMAERGIVFEDASTPLPNTTPAHASMLTGIFPSRHGSVALNVPMRRDVDTLAEALQRRGYYTAGSVAVSHIGRPGNFEQGFADFADLEQSSLRRNGDAVNASAIEFLSKRKAAGDARPFFLFVHYFDCHAPYGWWRGETVDMATFPVADRIRLYDESIRYVDGLIEKLYEFLRANGLAADTLFVVTSDHGEQIGERALPAGHADIYDETVRVPLLVFGRGMPATRVAEAVSLLDVAPSLAMAAGAKLTQPSDGRNIVPADGFLDRMLFAWRGPGAGRDVDSEQLVIGNPWYTRSVTLRSGRYRFIRNFDRVYRDVRSGPAPAFTAADRERFKPLALAATVGDERRYALPATSYEPFTVTLDVEAKETCKELVVSMPPGFRYFSLPLTAMRTRVQFSAARFDTLLIATRPAACSATISYRLDRPADAPPFAAEPVVSRLFAILQVPRKNDAGDELYDVEDDPKMIRNRIADRALGEVRKSMERRTRELYGAIYGRAFDRRKPTATLPPEEIEKLRSLGYLF
jgi:arylsulfatase A-like enzyme